ncbi:hypothetical protein MHB50_14850 [Siminovitchia sp. FSL H7-0308]|uniref:hypothetical protein n=1 Tax=Siminovitchia sp. FSL H7-0308 TaxID=2921432 RepID=UPI0030EC8C8A
MEDVVMWIGPNLHLVQYPVRRGELFNQVVVFKSYNYKPDSDDWGTPEEMDRRFAGGHPLVEKAISFIDRQIRWPMYDRLPLENWTKGNITLLGDAAHPMLQYLAQGGCQALEDWKTLWCLRTACSVKVTTRPLFKYIKKNAYRGQPAFKRTPGYGEGFCMRKIP